MYTQITTSSVYRVLFFLTLLTTAACSSAPENQNRQLSEQEQQSIQALAPISTEEGNQLLEKHCYSCHNPKSDSHDSMLAPPLAGIKYKYQEFYPDRTKFIAQMADFVQNPSSENALMKGPVKKFGLMPKVVLSEEEIRTIVAFMYDAELAVPKWFPAHFKEQHGQEWAQ
jgi:cytochrome c5